MKNTIHAAKRTKCTIICLQEINVRKGDGKSATLIEHAHALGFLAIISELPKNSTDRGGTATLIAHSLLCTKVASRSHSKGNTTITALIIPNLPTPSNKLRIVNVYGTQHDASRVAQFKSMGNQVNNHTLLNVVLDTALDVRRDATSPFNTAGAAELSTNTISQTRFASP